MKFVTIPGPVKLLNYKTKQPLPEPEKTFLDYAYDVWFNDPRVSKAGPAVLRQWMKMIDAFEAAKEPGSVAAIEDTPYGMLKGYIEAPEASYPPTLAAQCECFPSAVLGAPDKDPRIIPETIAAPKKAK